MIPLFSCRACGFLSTLGSEFTRIQGVTFDKDCAAAYERGEEPQRRWVEEKLPATAGRALLAEARDER